MSDKNLVIALAEGWYRVPEARINGRPHHDVWWHRKHGDPLNPHCGADPFGPPNYEMQYAEALATINKLRKYFPET